MNRRLFLSALVGTAAGVVVPEPVRAYSFVGGWREHVDHGFVLEGAGWPRMSVSVVIEHLRREGRAGALTRAENVRLDRLWNDAGEMIVRARVPALPPNLPYVRRATMP